MTTLRKRTYHGVAIGILMADTGFRRFAGDIGHAATWPFPVQYHVVRGAGPDKVTGDYDPAVLAAFKAGADELVAAGVDGITTSCGFLAIYQRELAAACSVPVATSALLQVPMVARTLPRGRRPAILTFSRPALGPRHLDGAGVDPDTPIFGMPETSTFQRAIRAGDPAISIEAIRQEVLDVARSAVAGDASIGALVLECTNLAPFAADVHRGTGLPVYDIVSLVHWFQRGLKPQRYPSD